MVKMNNKLTILNFKITLKFFIKRSFLIQVFVNISKKRYKFFKINYPKTMEIIISKEPMDNKCHQYDNFLIITSIIFCSRIIIMLLDKL